MSRHRSVLPGFGLSLGFTVAYLGLIVLVPLAATFLKTSGMTWDAFTQVVASPRVLASYRLTFGTAFLAALVNAFFGLIVAWVLVRYRFFGKRVVDALVDLPFALPTAVAGIALTAIFSAQTETHPGGWIGSWAQPLWGGVIENGPEGPVVVTKGFIQWLETIIPGVNWGEWLGLKLAFDRPGIFIALTFIGLPFVVRTLQPVLEELEPELEEASATLGASRWQTLTRVILPELTPALITGFAMAFARALGEYGSVVFIAGNMPNHSEITPLLIITKLEQYDYQGATAIAVVLLVISFTMLLLINLLQKWTRRHQRI